MSQTETKPFLEDGTAVVHRLRRALAEVLTAVGAPTDEPQEISRRLGLDKTLTWRIARLIGEDDAWEAVAHVPRRPSIKLLVDALAKHGAPEARLDSVWKAMEEFDRFVDMHSGDRETLEIMASIVSKRSAEKRLEVFRKDGYQANSAMWGVRAEVQLAAQLVSPGAIPGRLDLATVCGLAGFRRLRMNVPWAVATLRMWDTPQELGQEHAARFEPLDPAVPHGGIPLMRSFCTRPEMPVRAYEHDRQTRRYMLEGSEIGNTASADVFMGWVSRSDVSATETYKGEHGEHGMSISTPVVEIIHDLYLHRALEFKLEPDCHLYSQLPGGPQYATHGPNLALSLPVPHEVHDLGIGLPDGSISAIPRYREMIEAAVRQVGHRLEDYRAYRYRLRHPPIPSLSVLRHSLLPM